MVAPGEDERSAVKQRREAHDRRMEEARERRSERFAVFSESALAQSLTAGEAGDPQRWLEVLAQLHLPKLPEPWAPLRAVAEAWEDATRPCPS